MVNPVSLSKKRNVCLDLLKLLAAYFVVFIHFPFPGIFGDIVLDLGRFAVPLFFLVSGYYAYTSTPEKILKKLVHVLKLFLITALVYLVYKFVVEAFFKGTLKDGIIFLKGYSYHHTSIKFFLFNVTRSSGHLWFMPALVYCYGLFYLSRKKNLSENTLFLLGGILLLACFALEEGLALFGKNISFVFTRNFLFLGFPFFILGLLVFKYQTILFSLPINLLVFLVVFGLAGSVLSGLLIGKNEIYIGSGIAAVSLLILGLRGQTLMFSPFVTLLSEIGTPLYLWHCLIGESFVLPGVQETLELIPYWDFISPLLTCILSTCLAVLIYKITHKGENLCGKQ